MLTRPAGLLSVPKTTSTRLPPLMERTWSEKPPWRVAGKKNDLVAAYGPPAAVSPTMQRRQAKQLAAERRARRAKAADLSPPPKSPPKHVRTHSRKHVVAARRNQLPTDEASRARTSPTSRRSTSRARRATVERSAFRSRRSTSAPTCSATRARPTSSARPRRDADAGFAGFDDARSPLRVCRDHRPRRPVASGRSCSASRRRCSSAPRYEPAFLALYEARSFARRV